KILARSGAAVLTPAIALFEQPDLDQLADDAVHPGAAALEVACQRGLGGSAQALFVRVGREGGGETEAIRMEVRVEHPPGGQSPPASNMTVIATHKSVPQVSEQVAEQQEDGFLSVRQRESTTPTGRYLMHFGRFKMQIGRYLVQ